MKTFSMAAALALATAAFASPVAAADAAAGRLLYERFCSRCHGPTPVQFQSGANITTADAALLRNTIANNPLMGFLRFLTDAQVNDIIAYLNLQVGAAGTFNYTDQWWNAGESGWGITIVHRVETNQIFAVLNHYDEARRPVWYVLPGGSFTGNTFTGSLFVTSGPPLGGAYSAATVTVRQVGSASINFLDSSSATLSYEVDGRKVTKSITRQPF